MWIAKPQGALSGEEQASWNDIIKQHILKSGEVSLAQTLAWGRAIQAVAGKAFVVYSPEEGAGGLVYEDSGRFECVNGPLLDWDDPAKAPRQIAVFATAVSRLTPRFESLTLRPRWRRGQAEARLAELPVKAFATTSAATIKLGLALDFARSEALPYTPRLLRTLRTSTRAGITATQVPLSPSMGVEFALAAQAFGKKRGFSVPPVLWFRALTEGADDGLNFHLVTAQSPEGESGCQLLIAWHGQEAHYLFGHEWRAATLRQAVSPSSIAHCLAIQTAAEAGMRSYDFNGTLEQPDPSHAYAGVAAFKAQFGGSVVRYEVPELRIT